jgi:hypothetical protein
MRLRWLSRPHFRGYQLRLLLRQSLQNPPIRGFHLHQQNRGYQHLPGCLAHQQSQRHLLFRCFRGCLLRQPGLQRSFHQQRQLHHCRRRLRFAPGFQHYRVLLECLS